MRTFLLSFLAFSLAIGVMAQTPLQKQSVTLSKLAAVKTNAAAEYQQDFQGEANPYVSNPKIQDIIIGATRYDLQSNATLQSRIYAYDDGTVGGTWTMGNVEPGFTERGTGYNYFNGTSWGAIPTTRIEPVRTGWPAYQPYGDNGEIVCAHTGGANGLMFSWRENKGVGEWNNFYLAGPVGNEALLWPRMTTSGDNNEIIHVIAALDADYEGMTGALLYSRSFDGGQTWDPQNVLLDGINSNYLIGVGGDVYAWAKPVGETLAFVVGDFLSDGVVMKSTDGGDNWERMLYYEAPIPLFNNEVPLPDHGGLDGYNAVVIDDLGRVHVAAGRMIHFADGSGAGNPTNYYSASNGLLYWNETMPTMDSAAVTANILDPSGMNPMYLLAEVVDNGIDTIIGVATYQASMTSMPQLVFDPETKFLYAVYSSLTLGFATEEFNYRHVWMCYSEDYGQTWSDPQDLTGDIFHIFSECVFPSTSSNVTNKIHILFQSDMLPGINQRYEGHAASDNNMVYLPVERVTVGLNEVSPSILALEQISPNPAKDVARAYLQVDKAVQAEISLVNLVGQEVYNESRWFGYAGPHEVKIDVNRFETGVYFVKVKAGSSVVAKKLFIE